MFQNLRNNGLGNFVSGSCIVTYASSSNENGGLQFFNMLFDSNCGREIGDFYTYNIRDGGYGNIRAIRAF
jgi:hypothetical protein